MQSRYAFKKSTRSIQVSNALQDGQHKTLMSRGLVEEQFSRKCDNFFRINTLPNLRNDLELIHRER